MWPDHKRGWFQDQLCDDLQRFYEDLQAGLRPVLVISTPPQHGKSETVGDFIAWVAGDNPNLRTIFASYSDDLGVAANLRLQRLFDRPDYQSVFGQKVNTDNVVTQSGRRKRNSSLLEYVDGHGSFVNTTVMGQLTGKGFDLGIVDDPVKGRDEAESKTIRNKTWNWYVDDFSTRMAESAGVLVIMTRWHVDDLIGRIKLRAGARLREVCYPAIAIEDETHRKAGEALFPELKSLEFLLERKAERPLASWESLYQQNPIVVDGGLFGVGWIGTIEAAPQYGPLCRRWDLASTKSGDWTVGVKMCRTADGKFIVLDVIRFRGTPAEVERGILGAAELDGRHCHVVLPQDPGQAGVAQRDYYARKLAGYVIRFERETGSKVDRARPMSAQAEVGNVLQLRAAWNDVFTGELVAFPSGREDDQVDAASGAFNYLSGQPTGLPRAPSKIRLAH